MHPRLILMLLMTACFGGSAFAQEASAPNQEPPAAEADAANGDVSPAPVARVGTDVISGEEFRRNLEHFLQRLEAQQGRPVMPDTRMKMNVLNDMINARVIAILAQNAGITVSDAEVEEEFARRRRGLPTQTAYEGYLRREGLTEPELKDRIRARMKTEKYIQVATAGVEVDESLVQEEYDRWLKDGRLDRPLKTADFAHIVIGPEEKTEAAWNAAREQIEAARERILAGEDFGEVAKEVSQDVVSAHRGGVYFEANESVMTPELGEHLFTLPVGEVSEIFRSERGWHLMQVLQHNAPGQVSYEKVAKELRQNLEDQRRQERLMELIQSARNILDIEVYQSPREDAAPGGEDQNDTVTGDTDDTDA